MYEFLHSGSPAPQNNLELWNNAMPKYKNNMKFEHDEVYIVYMVVYWDPMSFKGREGSSLLTGETFSTVLNMGKFVGNL